MKSDGRWWPLACSYLPQKRKRYRVLLGGRKRFSYKSPCLLYTDLGSLMGGNSRDGNNEGEFIDGENFFRLFIAVAGERYYCCV